MNRRKWFRERGLHRNEGGTPAIAPATAVLDPRRPRAELHYFLEPPGRTFIWVVGICCWVGLGSCELAGPGKGRGPRTPEESFARFQRALTERDFHAFYDLLSRPWRDEIRDQLASDDEAVRRHFEAEGLDLDALRRLPLRDAFIMMTRRFAERNPEEFEAPARLTWRRPAFVTGNFATLRCQGDEGASQEFHFVREGDLWKLDHRLRVPAERPAPSPNREGTRKDGIDGA